MKKLFFYAATMASAFFAASCQQELLDPVQGGSTVTFSVEIPEVAGTKATIGDEPTSINDLVYAVYRTTASDLETTLSNWDEYASLVYQKNPSTQVFTDNYTTTVSLELINNQNYVILFWAQKNDVWVDGEDFDLTNITYPADSESNVNMVVNRGVADKYAAFSAVRFLGANEFAGQKTVELTRPFAQINIAAKDPVNYNVVVKSASMTVRSAGDSFNVASQSAPETKESLTYTWENIPATDGFVAGGVTYDHYVAMGYVFANDNVSVSYEINTASHGTVANATTPINNVPVAANYRTNIVGNLLTSDVDYNVTLDKDWGAEETKYEYVVLDGVNYISIATAKDLKYFADQVNAGDPEWINANILLANDIDLSELAQTRSTTSNWTPISMSTDLANGKTYRGIFNGNGKSIKNMVCEGTEVAGLFGYLYAATIKNVTIENATINSNHFAGGIVAWVNNFKGNIQMPFVIENCHVVGSTITSTPEQVNGEWDNGDKVGGLVGAAWFNQGSGLNVGTKIANCSVENTTIKAYRDFGGFVGYAQGVNIENCSTNGVTLEQDLTHDYKAPETPDTFGLTIGKNAGGNTIDGNEFVADGVTTDSEGNYHILNAAGLKWVADVVNTTPSYTPSIFDDTTIFLMNDINLNNEEWIPIGDFGNERTVFKGTFDGNGYTVSNFKVTKKTTKLDDTGDDQQKNCSYGLFGNVRGTIKNLTVSNATIDMCENDGKYVGALVGRIHGGVIENCSVKNSTIVDNNWTVGALVGQYYSAKISGCSVENTTITGYAGVSAIAGVALGADERTIENCSVKNCTIAQNGEFGGNYDNMFGAILGTLYNSALTVNLNNCSVENTTIKAIASDALCGYVSEGGVLLVNGGVAVSSADKLEKALENGGNITLVSNITMPKTLAISNTDFVLDGNGYTISQADDCTNSFALFDITGGKAAFKNVTFDGVKSGAVVRTVGVEFNAENVTAQNGQHTQVQGLFRLMGKSTIKNCTFKNNTCSMVITLNYDGANNDPQVVENCVFESNTCNGTGVLYYVKGAGATINANKFIKNTSTVTESDNAATLYMGFTENNVITNNVFQNNTVNVGTSKRVAGGLMIGYDAVITGNAFVGNTVNGENAKGNDVCASVYYTDINLSGNYWGGGAPVENDDYYKEYNNHEVIINDYLTENPIK